MLNGRARGCLVLIGRACGFLMLIGRKSCDVLLLCCVSHQHVKKHLGLMGGKDAPIENNVWKGGQLMPGKSEGCCSESVPRRFWLKGAGTAFSLSSPSFLGENAGDGCLFSNEKQRTIKLRVAVVFCLYEYRPRVRQTEVL